MYHHHDWFGPFSQHRQYCQLPALLSGRHVQRILQFTLQVDSHQVPFVLGRFAMSPHVAKASKVCRHYSVVAVTHRMYVIFEFPALHMLRQQYAPLFSTHPTP